MVSTSPFSVKLHYLCSEVCSHKKVFDRVSLIILRMLNFSVFSVLFHIADFHFYFYGRQIRLRYFGIVGKVLEA